MYLSATSLLAVDYWLLLLTLSYCQFENMGIFHGVHVIQILSNKLPSRAFMHVPSSSRFLRSTGIHEKEVNTKVPIESQ